MRDALKPGTVNENQVRITACWVLLLSVVTAFTTIWQVPAFLAVDFGLRGFGFGKYSPLHRLSALVCRLFNFGVKPVYAPPKLFAAKIGFAINVAIVVLLLYGALSVAVVLAIVISLFAFLEWMFGFCAGCYMFSFLTNTVAKSRS